MSCRFVNINDVPLITGVTAFLKQNKSTNPHVPTIVNHIKMVTARTSAPLCPTAVKALKAAINPLLDKKQNDALSAFLDARCCSDDKRQQQKLSDENKIRRKIDKTEKQLQATEEKLRRLRVDEGKLKTYLSDSKKYEGQLTRNFQMMTDEAKQAELKLTQKLQAKSVEISSFRTQLNDLSIVNADLQARLEATPSQRTKSARRGRPAVVSPPAEVDTKTRTTVLNQWHADLTTAFGGDPVTQLYDLTIDAQDTKIGSPGGGTANTSADIWQTWSHLSKEVWGKNRLKFICWAVVHFVESSSVLDVITQPSNGQAPIMDWGHMSAWSGLASETPLTKLWSIWSSCDGQADDLCKSVNYALLSVCEMNAELDEPIKLPHMEFDDDLLATNQLGGLGKLRQLVSTHSKRLHICRTQCTELLYEFGKVCQDSNIVLDTIDDNKTLEPHERQLIKLGLVLFPCFNRQKNHYPTAAPLEDGSQPQVGEWMSPIADSAAAQKDDWQFIFLFYIFQISCRELGLF
jgi:hypothetical protein